MSCESRTALYKSFGTIGFCDQEENQKWQGLIDDNKIHKYKVTVLGNHQKAIQEWNIITMNLLLDIPSGVSVLEADPRVVIGCQPTPKKKCK